MGQHGVLAAGDVTAVRRAVEQGRGEDITAVELYIRPKRVREVSQDNLSTKLTNAYGPCKQQSTKQ